MAKIDEQLVDRRTVDRNIEKGLLTRKDYEAYLGKLKDSEDNAETVSLEEDEVEAEGADEAAETEA
ncbi:MAG: hypothetical protein JJ863_35100 [Deltaproteobacteria bacterium]|nr:hypothetical protein [Deltaproteobacteria bacterium]